VKTQSANVTLALGGSPIMAEAEAEQADLARIPGGLLINFGTLEAHDGMIAAGRHANQNGKPVVFDPVGVGATAFRRATAASERDFCISVVWGKGAHCPDNFCGSQNCWMRGSRR
jgi:thiamine-phosphate diphosphorylase/hydroxyethylthiazole kinase